MIGYTDLYPKRFSCQNPYATSLIIFCVVVFINLCSFSNIIDTVSGSFQVYLSHIS